MTNEELAKQYEKRANQERDAGASIEINLRFGYIAIDRSDGAEYFFQGEEAMDLYDETPEWINPEDYILAISQNW